eukprot:PhM_4_TR3472/c5_g1_i1/m.77850
MTAPPMNYTSNNTNNCNNNANSNNNSASAEQHPPPQPSSPLSLLGNTAASNSANHMSLLAVPTTYDCGDQLTSPRSVALSPRHRKQRGDDDEHPGILTEFVPSTEIPALLLKRHKEGMSVLQRFVLPAHESVDVMEATWSERVFRCERRCNIHKYGDTHVPITRRVCTYEGDWVLSRKVNVSTACSERVRRAIELMVQHVREVYYVFRLALTSGKSLWLFGDA